MRKSVSTFVSLADTQRLLDARKNANAMYEKFCDVQMQQIYELDLAIGVFEALNPALYKGIPAGAGNSGYKK